MKNVNESVTCLHVWHIFLYPNLQRMSEQTCIAEANVWAGWLFSDKYYFKDKH